MRWGIEAIHPYLPAWGVERRAFSEASGEGGKGSGIRRIAGPDEDPLTLSFSALFPFRGEKGTLVSVLSPSRGDLPFPILKLSLGMTRGYPLSGGFRAGWNLLATEPRERLILSFAEVRYAPWDDPCARFFSDGGGALLWGDNPFLAYLASWEEETPIREITFDPAIPGYRMDPQSFGMVEGFLDLFQRCIKELTPRNSTTWLLSLPHPSWAHRIKQTFSQIPIITTDHSGRGFVGGADPIFLLADSAPRWKVGERVGIVTYDGGITAILFEVRSPLALLSLRHPEPLHLATPYLWARFRGVESAYPRAPGEPPALSGREMKGILTRTGFRCKRCANLTFPFAPSCITCGSTEGGPDTLSFRGEVFTFTIDYLHPSLVPPTTMIVAEMEGGGRVYLQGTDDLQKEVKVGTPVELTLRILHYGEDGNTPVYFWKFRGAR
jgi:uncharacterized OB-fold protein